MLCTIYNSKIKGYENNPECINDFSMYVISRISMTELKNMAQTLLHQILNHKELTICAEIMYNIYLDSPKEEYNEAIITCIKILSYIIICCTREAQENAFEKIYTICGMAIENGNNTVFNGCLQEFSEIIRFFDNSAIQNGTHKHAFDILDNAFKAKDSANNVEYLGQLSDLIIGYENPITQRIASEIIFFIYDKAFKEKNEEVLEECQLTLLEIVKYSNNETILEEISKKIPTITNGDSRENIECPQDDLRRFLIGVNGNIRYPQDDLAEILAELSLASEDMYARSY